MSKVGAVGPTRFQAAIPFSMARAEKFISLRPMTLLLAALSRK